jgi:hypothetical protein
MNLKPDEQAVYLFQNALYFVPNRLMAKQLVLYQIEIILRLKLKIDDQIYWKLVKEHAYDLEK